MTTQHPHRQQSPAKEGERLRDLLLDHPVVRAYVSQLVTFAAERLRIDTAALRNDGPVSCSFILDCPERPVTIAGSHALVVQRDEAAHHVDGPCLNALQSGEHVIVGDVAAQTQWPAYRDAVTPLGVRSVMSIPVWLAHAANAVMNFYSTSPDAFDDMTVETGTALATQAAQALLLAPRMIDDGHHAKGLHGVLQSRTTIDLAVGIIMGRSNCGQQVAFEILRSESNNCNVALQDVATDIVTPMGAGPPSVHGQT